jgi:type I restriction enzyme, S subunit
MGGEWKETTLGQCASWLSGGTPFKGTDAFWSGSIPWVSAKDMKSFRLHDAEDHISPLAVGSGGKLVPAGTILLLVRGMTLHNDVPICMIMREMAFNQDIKALRPAKNVDGAFLAYWLLANKTDLLASVDHAGHGTGRLVTDTLKEKPVLLPSFSDQKAIAAVLGALDDKIELNRRMNATLEAMARALFQSWFVDFDPVHAKLDGRQPAALNPAAAALFPGQLEDSPLGHIPKGWEVKTLSDLATLITKGTTPTQDDMNSAPDSDAQINYVRVNSIDEDGSVIAAKLTKIPKSVHSGVLKRSILMANDILYTIAGTIGRIALAEDWILPANTNQAVAIIRPEPEIPSGFLTLAMRHEIFRGELHNNIVHAVQANLSLGMLSKARVVVPPQCTLQQLFKPIDALLSQISANEPNPAPLPPCATRCCRSC